MAFKILDLLISDLSTEKVAYTKVTGPPRLLAVWGCTKTSVTGHLCGTTALTVTTVTLLTCLPFLFRRKLEDSAEQIALLKAQLKEALEEIELEEASRAEQFTAKTVEEAEKLQDKLRKAVEQLEQDKSKLRER
jgi:ABC-type transport system involved in cytochrome bd biosynthesis fused ATPase/permease subunit